MSEQLQDVNRAFMQLDPNEDPSVQAAAQADLDNYLATRPYQVESGQTYLPKAGKPVQDVDKYFEANRQAVDNKNAEAGWDGVDENQSMVDLAGISAKAHLSGDEMLINHVTSELRGKIYETARRQQEREPEKVSTVKDYSDLVGKLVNRKIELLQPEKPTSPKEPEDTPAAANPEAEAKPRPGSKSEKEKAKFALDVVHDTAKATPRTVENQQEREARPVRYDAGKDDHIQTAIEYSVSGSEIKWAQLKDKEAILVTTDDEVLYLRIEDDPETSKTWQTLYNVTRSEKAGDLEGLKLPADRREAFPLTIGANMKFGDFLECVVKMAEVKDMVLPGNDEQLEFYDEVGEDPFRNAERVISWLEEAKLKAKR